MTTTEAAALLGLSPTTVRRQIETGALRAVKHGRDWHVTPAAVEAYRAERLGTRKKRPSIAIDGQGTEP